MKLVSESQCFGGRQLVYEHASQQCRCDMRLGVYLPPQSRQESVPWITWLSGLTCTEDNFVTKAGAQRMASELGLAIVAPDTSPRGDDVPDATDAWDFGKGAGFYVDATRPPWSTHFRMYSYVTEELQSLVVDHFPLDPARRGISGHSMGGHGALVAHLRNPQRFLSVSAFAPIVAPSDVPWGQKAFSGYLGDDASDWAAYDATRLVSKVPSKAEILIDQGAADSFLDEQLQPQRFAEACEEANQSLMLRIQPEYDHSYFFIASFIEDHLRHHASVLTSSPSH